MAKLLWLVFLLRSTLVHSLGTACSAPVTSGTAAASDPYWLENIVHQGTAAFNADPSSYTVFRNVMDFGAVGMILPLILFTHCLPPLPHSSSIIPAFLPLTSSITDYKFGTGDGVTDDTAAINAAISSGDRCVSLF